MPRIIVMARDEVGVIADISRVLAESKINIETISVEALGDKGAVSLTTNDYDGALLALTYAGFKTVTDESLLVSLRDEPGALAKVAERLKLAGINIQSIQIVDRREGNTTVAIVTNDRAMAEGVIGREAIV